MHNYLNHSQKKTLVCLRYQVDYNKSKNQFDLLPRSQVINQYEKAALTKELTHYLSTTKAADPWRLTQFCGGLKNEWHILNISLSLSHGTCIPGMFQFIFLFILI